MSKVSWDKASGGCMPPGSVVGGYDINGEKIYVGRVNHSGDLIPGKIVPSHGVCYVSWHGHEYGYRDYEALTNLYNCQLDWVSASYGRVPDNPVEGGRQANGEILYIGKSIYSGSKVVGKVHPDHSVLYIPFDGKEIGLPNYKVLCYKEQTKKWFEKIWERKSKQMENSFQKNNDEIFHIKPKSESQATKLSQLYNKMRTINKNQEINILVLGQNGVGKSTFINAIANYLNYEKLEEAEQNELVSLIPIKFNITDENYEIHKVTYDNDDDEKIKDAISKEKLCMSYVFPFGNYSIRIIDTPGMSNIPVVGDVRWIKHYKKNIKNLMSFIEQYDDLHAICILMKPNEKTLTDDFEFCLEQLLGQSKFASQNIVFVFTNARSTFYKPGETLIMLKNALTNITKNPAYDITLNKNTIFCLDNEGLHYLAAVRNGIRFTQKEKKIFATSWRNSFEETMRLFNKIIDEKEKFGEKTNNVKDFSVNFSQSLDESLSEKLKFQKPLDSTCSNQNRFFKNSTTNLSNPNIKKFSLKESTISTIDLTSSSPKNFSSYQLMTSGNINNNNRQAFSVPKLDKSLGINILVLGETGVGKSTFINGIANYLTYQTLEEAELNELISLIPIQFNVMDENYEMQKVTSGQDDNEDAADGQSATQTCRCYVFPYENHLIRIIDTPGIGDVRGIGQDKKNTENIMSFLGQYDNLHAICILMKPNNARLTVEFQFCLKQLLCQLSKSASQNIVFVFTNARSNFYKPGETLPLIKNILTSNSSHTNIPINKNTVFCLDNEAFRFLVAIQNGIKFTPEQKRDFANSWRHSFDESMRMINRVIGDQHQPGLAPHKVKDTLSVNEARQAIINLSQPLAEISKIIQDNLKILEKSKGEVKNNSDNIKELKNKLIISELDLIIKELKHPATVCAHKNCSKYFQVCGLTRWNYKKHCHSACHCLDNVCREVLGDPNLKECWAMQPSGETCRECQHSYELHMHVYYESEVVEKKTEDKNIQRQIHDKESAKRAAEQTILQMERKRKTYEREQDIITKAMAKFGHFLKTNAIAPYNDSFKDYLQHLIENEKGWNSKEKVAGLEQILSQYEISTQILEQAIDMYDEPSNIDSDTIYEIIDQLFDLELTGDKFIMLYQTLKEAKIRENNNHRQIFYKPKNFNIASGNANFSSDVSDFYIRQSNSTGQLNKKDKIDKMIIRKSMRRERKSLLQLDKFENFKNFQVDDGEAVDDLQEKLLNDEQLKLNQSKLDKVKIVKPTPAVRTSLKSPRLSNLMANDNKQLPNSTSLNWHSGLNPNYLNPIKIQTYETTNKGNYTDEDKADDLKKKLEEKEIKIAEMEELIKKLTSNFINK